MNSEFDAETVYANIHEKMNVEKLRFTDELVDAIIDYTAADISLTELDVKDLAIYTLYSIVVLGNDNVAAPIIKNYYNDIIGDSAKTIECLRDTLNGIAATDEVAADKLFEKYIEPDDVDGGV